MLEKQQHKTIKETGTKIQDGVSLGGRNTANGLGLGYQLYMIIV